MKADQAQTCEACLHPLAERATRPESRCQLRYEIAATLGRVCGAAEDSPAPVRCEERTREAYARAEKICGTQLLGARAQLRLLQMDGARVDRSPADARDPAAQAQLRQNLRALMTRHADDIVGEHAMNEALTAFPNERDDTYRFVVKEVPRSRLARAIVLTLAQAATSDRSQAAKAAAALDAIAASATGGGESAGEHREHAGKDTAWFDDASYYAGLAYRTLGDHVRADARWQAIIDTTERSLIPGALVPAGLDSAWLDDAYWQRAQSAKLQKQPAVEEERLLQLIARCPTSRWVDDAYHELSLLAAARGDSKQAQAYDTKLAQARPASRWLRSAAGTEAKTP